MALRSTSPPPPPTSPNPNSRQLQRGMSLFATIMRSMHMFRTSSLLARLILAWFVLTVGVAIASPLVHPQGMELVCTTGGTVKLVVLGDDDDGAMDSSHHTLEIGRASCWERV